jgi:hypothetical protein
MVTTRPNARPRIGTPALPERVRRQVRRLLDRLDARWENDESVGRWSGACWCAYGRYQPAGGEGR